MKILTFVNRKTGAIKKVHIKKETSNITASHQFRDTHGKEWGLVESTQSYTK